MSSNRPTARQLSYLKSLAERTGTSFAYPHSAAEASREIDRLRALRQGGGGLVRVDHERGGQRSLAREAQELGLAYATAPQPGEITGYGSTASWSTGASEPSPTPAQLSYIASLARRLAIDAPQAQTRAEASREIDRLRGLTTNGSARAARGGARRERSCIGQARPAPSAGQPSTARTVQREARSAQPSSTPAAEDSREPARVDLYRTPTGEQRELAAVPGVAGSTLLIDRRLADLADARLIAHLSEKEPVENVPLLCAMYLDDPSRGRCRLVSAADFQSDPAARDTRGSSQPADTTLRAEDGGSYRIREVQRDRYFRELRWTRSEPGSSPEKFQIVGLRDVVEALERYEPVQAMTRDALAAAAHSEGLSTRNLKAELDRLDHARIVLNRGLREALERQLARGETTLSEIAMRCGRCKRNKRGASSGETSWLLRRVGLRPEGGMSDPARWIHSETLALIAREGLGLSPYEVEVA